LKKSLDHCSLSLMILMDNTKISSMTAG